jgi:hypothetical protein
MAVTTVVGTLHPRIGDGGDGKAAQDDTAQCCGEKRIHVTISFQLRTRPTEIRSLRWTRTQMLCLKGCDWQGDSLPALEII